MFCSLYFAAASQMQKQKEKTTQKRMIKFKENNFLLNYIGMQPAPLGKRSSDDTTTWVTLKAVPPLYSRFPNFVMSEVRQG